MIQSKQLVKGMFGLTGEDEGSLFIMRWFILVIILLVASD